MKKLFESEVNYEIAKHADAEHGIFTEKDITFLPEPVKKYIAYCGYLNKPKIVNARFDWGDVFFRRNPEAKWLKLRCYQLNSVPEPSRIVYMKSRLLGIFPFEGRDKFQDGEGNMLIKLMKFITIDNNKGREMNISALVTLLSEVLLLPTSAVQNYISWNQINSNTAGATITFNGIKAGGIFYFNDLGEYIKFNSKDRFQAAGKSKYKKVDWSATAGDYIEKQNINFPTALSAVWHDDYGDFEYFRGRITNIQFNVKKM